MRAEEDNGDQRSVQAWQYDANGYPTRYQVDNDGDGTFEDNAEYRYQNTGWGFLFAGVSPSAPTCRCRKSRVKASTTFPTATAASGARALVFAPRAFCRRRFPYTGRFCTHPEATG